MPRNTFIKEEGVVAALIRERGYEAEKRGYPDFMIIKDDEILGFIEAKPNGGERLKPEQERFERFCRKHDIPFLTFNLGMGTPALDEFLRSL